MSRYILFIGRQPDTYAPLWRHLLLKGFQVSFAVSQTRALREIENFPVEVIVLDPDSLRVTPDHFTRVLRQRAPAARIVLITEKAALNSYSYDYWLPHTVTWLKLQKVIEEALTSENRHVLVRGPFVLDLAARTLVGPTCEARLTNKLFSLLLLLMRNSGRYISRNQIMQEIWHTSYVEDTRTLDVHMSWLRRLVEPDPKAPIYLLTKRGVGYTFAASASEETEPKE